MCVPVYTPFVLSFRPPSPLRFRRLVVETLFLFLIFGYDLPLVSASLDHPLLQLYLTRSEVISITGKLSGQPHHLLRGQNLTLQIKVYDRHSETRFMT